MELRGTRVKRRTWLATAAACLFGGAWACGAEPTPGMRVKAMTFNIRLSRAHDGANAWPHRRELVVELIRRFAADFVGVQEAWPEQIAYLAQALPQYRYLGRSREREGVEGEAIPLFYRHQRWSLDPEEQGTFWLSDTPEVPGSTGWGNQIPRVITWGRFIEKAGGGALYVYNVHLDHLSAVSRVRSARALAERIARRAHGEPVLVLGDFNAGESSEPIRYLTGLDHASPVQLRDTFRVLHPEATLVGTFHGFGGATTGPKIDYVLASPEVRVIQAAIIHDSFQGRYASDHFPVTAELFVPKQ